jgi:hypothetical protein
MSYKRYTEEFKIDAVKQEIVAGHSLIYVDDFAVISMLIRCNPKKTFTIRP